MSKIKAQKYGDVEWAVDGKESVMVEAASSEALVIEHLTGADDMQAIMKVIGIGGGGSNAVNSMVDSGIEGVRFIIANTDAQALKLSSVEHKIQIGTKITKGLGAGSNPEIGRRAALEDLETIVAHIKGSDILFLTAGMGGGTGSGAITVVAEAAKELGILTVAIVTKPFLFEGKKRAQQAHESIESLREVIDTLIVIPNQKLIELADPKISILDAFAMANNVLRQAIKGVADIIVRPGHMNVDFADVRSIMKGMGMAIMGTGCSKGKDRAQEAAEQAINSSLVEDICIEGAKGVLINITGNGDLGLHEISQAAHIIYEKAASDANIILGSVIDPNMGDEVMVTIIATGFSHMPQEVAMPARQQVVGNTISNGVQFVGSAHRDLYEEGQISSSRIDVPAYIRRNELHASSDED